MGSRERENKHTRAYRAYIYSGWASGGGSDTGKREIVGEKRESCGGLASRTKRE